jgi:phosphatidate cytidylyltransferase
VEDRPSDEASGDEGERRRPGAPRPSNEGVRIIGAEEAAAALEAGQVSGRRPEDEPRFGDVPEQPRGPRPSLSFPRQGDDAPSRRPEARRLFQPPPARDRAVYDPPPPGTPAAATPPEPPAREPEPPPTREARPAPDPRPQARVSARPDGRATIRPDGPAAGNPKSGGPATGPTVLPHWTEPPTGEVPRILAGDDEAEDDLGVWGSFSGGPRWRDQHTDWDNPDFEDQPLLPPESETPVGVMAEPAEEPAGSIYLGEAPAAEPEDAPITIGVGSDSARAALYDEPPGVREGPGRDVGVAVLTGVVVGIVVLVAAALGPAALVIVTGACLVVAAAELFGTLRQRGHHPGTLLGLIGTISLLGANYWKGEDAIPLVLTLFVVFTLLWYLVGVVRARPAINVAVTLMAFMYVGFLGSFAALLLAFPGRRGVAYFLGAVIATVAHDVGAFAVGSRLGRTPLAPSISPNKTWEGVMGASTATLVACLLIVRAIHPWNVGRAFALALVVSVVAPIGDLCESMLKRDLGVKDIGWVLPGHGGFLDRIDALLFVAPATYYLVRLLKIV